MKILYSCFIITITFALLITGCNQKEEINKNCHSGTVIGKIRSAGGGLAVSASSDVFGRHEWRGYKNVVEALNLDFNYAPGTKIFFEARPATEQEKNYPMTADGDESAKPIIFVTEVSTIACPQGEVKDVE